MSADRMCVCLYTQWPSRCLAGMLPCPLSGLLPCCLVFLWPGCDFVQREFPSADGFVNECNAALSKYTSFKEQLERDVAILKGSTDVGTPFSLHPRAGMPSTLFPQASPHLDR